MCFVCLDAGASLRGKACQLFNCSTIEYMFLDYRMMFGHPGLRVWPGMVLGDVVQAHVFCLLGC